MTQGEQRQRGPGAVARGWVAAHPPVRAIAPGALLVAIGVLGFLVLLDSVSERDDLTILDQPVLGWLVSHRSTGLTAVLNAVTLVSGPTVLPVVVALGCVVWGVLARAWWRPGLLAAAMVVSTLISLAVKSSVARPRPPAVDMLVPGAETTFSFPSGHTIGAAVLTLTLGYLVVSRRRTRRAIVWWTAVAATVVLTVALSRLYLGYHFLTDVVAAIALAVATLGGVVAVDRVRRPSGR